MTTLGRKKLRRLILKEIQKIMDEETLFSKNDYKGYGMLSKHDDPARQAMYMSCSECGYSMKEGESMCEQCGSMYEAGLNEGSYGSCGTCESCMPIDSDLDDDFIPDHMTPQGGHDFDEMQDAMFDRFPHMKNIEVEFDYDNDDVKIGNHKVFKGSYMAKSHLYKVHKYAEKLYHMIPDGHNLEDWMRSKLAQIADDIGEVYHALDHDIYEGDI